jgi:hypothetical protein
MPCCSSKPVVLGKLLQWRKFEQAPHMSHT